MRLVILYLPGLGDHYDMIRRPLLRCWRLLGVDTRLIPSTWYNDEDLAAKLQRVETVIEAVAMRGDSVVLIGESAGAALALHIAAARTDIRRVITLCGVASPHTPIAPSLRRRAPALDEAVRTLPTSYQAPVISLSAITDHVVNARYSTVAGAEHHTIWSVGHFLTIGVCLTLLAPFLIGLARRA